MRPERWSELRERIEGSVTPPRRAVLRRFAQGVCICATLGFGGLTVWSALQFLGGCAGLGCDEWAFVTMLFGALTAASALPLVAWAADARNERDRGRSGRL